MTSPNSDYVDETEIRDAYKNLLALQKRAKNASTRAQDAMNSLRELLSDVVSDVASFEDDDGVTVTLAPTDTGISVIRSANLNFPGE